MKQTSSLSLLDVPFEDFATLVEQAGHTPFRAKQLYEWLHVHHGTSLTEIPNIPSTLKQYLQNNLAASLPCLAQTQASRDASKKLLLQLDKTNYIECVGIPTKERLSVCISSQAGCALGCAFCATGQAGFSRNLTPGEMLIQLSFMQFAFGKKPTSVVVMGQGEPFMNYTSAIKALHLIHKEFNIGTRKITVSTAGIPLAIRNFSHEKGQFGLAISLHSAKQEIRDMLMPGVAQFPLSQLKEALMYYTSVTNRRPTYEYLLLDDYNDTDEDLYALLDFCKSAHCYVNLLRLHPTPHSSFSPSTKEREQAFLKALRAHNIEVSVRSSRGEDIDAACGQLANTKQRRSF